MPITTTGVDVFTVIKKRLQCQGLNATDSQVHTLMADIMKTASTDAANIVAHAATELVHNPQRPFVFGI